MKIEQDFKEDNIELKQAHETVEYLQVQLKRTQTMLLARQSQFYQLQAQLRQAQFESQWYRGEVTAMKTSKFWKLRTAWFKFKSLVKSLLTSTTAQPQQNPFSELPIDFLPSLPPILSEEVQIAPANAELSEQPATYKQVFANLYGATLKSFLNSGTKLQFPTVSNPSISIILVLHNRAELTLQCLFSLFIQPFKSFELIIVDNASHDATSLLLERLQGAKIIRNQENRHFLLGSNQAAREASGEYLLFLNNDAQVLPGSIDSAFKTIRNADDIGAVGGKIILLDGSLQEAGSIVWKDGSCLGYGRGDSPFEPMYMFQRDVDYCSGAFLLTKKELFVKSDGFDEDYKPAYYEETDYCLKLWEMGKRVVYDPNAVILHHEFASSNSINSAISLQASHRRIFISKHEEKLQSHYLPSQENILIARAVDRSRPRVLFLDDRVPHSFLGSGYPRAREIILALLEMNCFVTFYPLFAFREHWDSVYQDIPNEVEVMVDYGPDWIDTFLQERMDYYSVIIVSRPHNMQILKQSFERILQKSTKPKIVYDAEAIFTMRELAQRKLKGEEVSEEEANELLASELDLARDVDSIISVSLGERKKFNEYGFENVRTLGHVLSVEPTHNSFEQRRDILFVGAIHQESAPNADSLLWFAKEVFPKVQSYFNSDIKFIFVGFNTSEKVKDLESEAIKIVGQVSDLTPYYNRSRIFVAPTRFAAGIPFKVHHAAAHGLPIVSTSLIASQLGWQDSLELLVADDSTNFAEQCIKLYSQQTLWETLRNNALERVNKDCSKKVFMDSLRQVIQVEK